LTLHDRGTILGHILSEHRDEVDPEEVGAARSGFGDRSAIEWHVGRDAIRSASLMSSCSAAHERCLTSGGKDREAITTSMFAERVWGQ
jgi:hypothetical protein